jgi:hypothetical protein
VSAPAHPLSLVPLSPLDVANALLRSVVNHREILVHGRYSFLSDDEMRMFHTVDVLTASKWQSAFMLVSGWGDPQPPVMAQEVQLAAHRQGVPLERMSFHVANQMHADDAPKWSTFFHTEVRVCVLVCVYKREEERTKLCRRGFGSLPQVSPNTKELPAEAIGKITQKAAGYKWTDDNCERIPAIQVAMQVCTAGLLYWVYFARFFNLTTCLQCWRYGRVRATG